MLAPAARRNVTHQTAAAHNHAIQAFDRRHPHSLPEGASSTSFPQSSDEYPGRAGPEKSKVPTATELNERRGSLRNLLACAKDEIQSLSSIVKEAGYALLVCDAEGVVVDDGTDQPMLNGPNGTWLGSVWSQQAVGTNGASSWTVDEEPPAADRDQQLNQPHIDLSACQAPIFGPDGNSVAMLRILCTDPALSGSSHALAASLLEASARAIEDRLFRDRFRQSWIVAVAQPGTTRSAFLLAVDHHQYIVGADRNARLAFPEHTFGGKANLWNIYERHPSAFKRNDGTDTPARLTVRTTGEVFDALITPPQHALPGWRNPSTGALHTRPRLIVIRNESAEAGSRARGGLAPHTLQRVREYVESHIDENISLEMLAAIARLSVFHFARSFKQTTGVTAHTYLLQRRVERAAELLLGTDLSLSEIALRTGFACHSHFARQFRRMSGMSPSEVRRNRQDPSTRPRSASDDPRDHAMPAH